MHSTLFYVHYLDGKIWVTNFGQDPTADRFIAALEMTEQASRDMPHTCGSHLVTDKKKIHDLFLKWKDANG